VKIILLISIFLSISSYAQGIKSDYKPGEIKKLCAKYIKDAKVGFDAIAKVKPADRTFATTTLPYENIGADLSDQLAPLLFMMHVSTDKKVRTESTNCQNVVSDFSVETSTRRDLYNAMKDVVGKTPEEKRLQFRTVQGFEESGLKLDDKKLKEVKKVQKALAKIQTEFRKNLNDSKSEFTATDEELKGIRPDSIANLKNDAKGLRIVPVNEGTYFDIMNSADNAKTREKMISAFMNRAAKLNTVLVQRSIVFRQDLAKLLGYKTWFDYKTEPRMAKNSETVRKFLTELKEKLAAANKRDMDQLLAFKKKMDPTATKLNQEDLLYLDFQMKKQDYKVDGNLVREYFPADVVIQGMFDVYSQILGVNYVEVPKAAVWSNGVKLYEVRDKKDSRLIGYFYTDFFPREGKYDHAAAFQLYKGRLLKDGKYEPPVSAIVANLSPPTEGKLSLLSHKDVETMFHEFGHIMHDVLTTAPYNSLSGTSTTRDFVEAPSQMLENWVFESEVLEKISGHYQDHSKKLPKDLLKKMLAARDFQQGRFYIRQLTFGFYDYNIHTESGPIDATKTYDDVFRELTGIDQVANAHFPATFGHMMDNYDGGYYGYLWSKVYAQDMFTVFQKEGVLSPKVGARYRNNILAPGDMEDADELLKKFLGREPNNKAFFKYLHI
jgi:thimet oligopeptidase